MRTVIVCLMALVTAACAPAAARGAEIELYPTYTNIGVYITSPDAKRYSTIRRFPTKVPFPLPKSRTTVPAGVC